MKKNKLKYVLACCVLCAFVLTTVVLFTIVTNGWFLVAVGIAALLAWAMVTIAEFRIE